MSSAEESNVFDDAILAYVTSNPGVLRSSLIAEVGKSLRSLQDAGKLESVGCGLVVSSVTPSVKDDLVDKADALRASILALFDTENVTYHVKQIAKVLDKDRRMINPILYKFRSQKVLDHKEVDGVRYLWYKLPQAEEDEEKEE